MLLRGLACVVPGSSNYVHPKYAYMHLYMYSCVVVSLLCHKSTRSRLCDLCTIARCWGVCGSQALVQVSGCMVSQLWTAGTFEYPRPVLRFMGNMHEVRPRGALIMGVGVAAAKPHSLFWLVLLCGQADIWDECDTK